MSIDKILAPTKRSQDAPKPDFFDFRIDTEQARFKSLVDENPNMDFIDTYESQLEEYFVLQNPSLLRAPNEKMKKFHEYRNQHFEGFEPWQAGKWVYIPWRHAFLHLLDDEMYQEVRTGRNRHLITTEEQKKFYNSKIGVAGLSVGSSIALAIVQSGGGKHMKLADPDKLELTNLNRIRGSVSDLTEYKTHMAARQIYELDPYADIEIFNDGVTKENVDSFVSDLDLVIDEIDSLPLKILIRDVAKKKKIPLIMAADNGETGVIDVERHDIEETDFFHGRVSQDKIKKIIEGNITPPELMQIIGGDIVGFDIHEERMLYSLSEIGRSVPTWPQLGVTAIMNGGFMATVARRIITGQSSINGRAVVSMPSYLDPDYTGEKATQQRQEALSNFLKKMNSK